MRHCRTIGAAILLSVATSIASACSCVKWDPSYHAAERAIIFLGEVVASDRAHPEQVKWHSELVSAVPIEVKVLESLKGNVAGNRRFLQVGRPSSCEIDLAVGAKRIFLVSKSDQTMVGYCDVASPTQSNLDGLRAATRGKQ